MKLWSSNWLLVLEPMISTGTNTASLCFLSACRDPLTPSRCGVSEGCMMFYILPIGFKHSLILTSFNSNYLHIIPSVCTYGCTHWPTTPSDLTAELWLDKKDALISGTPWGEVWVEWSPCVSVPLDVPFYTTNKSLFHAAVSSLHFC